MKINRGLLAAIPAIIFAACTGVPEQVVRPSNDSYAPTRLTVVIEGVSEVVDGAMVTREFFTAGDLKPHLGRFFIEQDYVARNVTVGVISHRYWVDRFRSNPSVVGSPIRVNEHPTIIVGVAPRRFQPERPSILWIPKVD